MYIARCDITRKIIAVIDKLLDQLNILLTILLRHLVAIKRVCLDDLVYHMPKRERVKTISNNKCCFYLIL